MQQITVESSLGEKLAVLDAPVVLFDTKGHALGLFSQIHGGTRAEEFDLEPPISIAETEELRKVRTGKPLEEILNRLGLRGSSDSP